MYNSIGQLSCTICNVYVKNNNLWGPHVAGKTHKENLLKPKKSNTNENSVKTAVQSKSTNRNLEQENSVKKLKSNDAASLEQPQSSKKVSLLASYSSSDESDDDNGSETSLLSKGSVSNTLPPDFFDNNAAAAGTTDVPSQASQSAQSEKQENGPEPSSNVETLPEGFFDDPVLDAKARNIEYKDPVEEEWEKFQKTIAEETNVSKTLMEEDFEERTLERDIDQIDEQIQQWERVKNLQVKADDVKVTAPPKNKNDGDSGTSDDELQEDDLLDWRSKGVKKV
ncbi:hypothetical protein JTE90_014382 [Oedothorax gibbosus]|uniref:Zinc finger protein 830 n=1 Tax=Oedothorax gibbosus TaxID=931172 RepID=A0AAV6V5B2_9ARAC|nr:hypothetical protein JTE90_014382 [Oedothorax gibbosus]